MTVSHVAVVVSILKDFFGSEIQGISPAPLPDTELVKAYITVGEVITRTDQDLEGSTGFEEAVIQVNAWHGDYDIACDIRTRAQYYLNSFSGDVLGVTVQAATHRDSTELYDGPRLIWQAIARMNIGFEEAA